MLQYSSKIRQCRLPVTGTLLFLSTSAKGLLRMSMCTSSKTSGSVRINQCIPSLSRRQADKAILDGRITVNGQPAKPGMLISVNDKLSIDGIPQTLHFDRKNIVIDSIERAMKTHIYIKMWKPLGVVCTADRKEPDNIFDFGRFDKSIDQRLITVGRLDKDSTGVILLTTDGVFSNNILGKRSDSIKRYEVVVNRNLTDSELTQLSEGVVITSETTSGKLIRGKTLPCEITADINPKCFKIKLVEGRNRQIKKMVESINAKVVSLHRLSFAGIGLRGLEEGTWTHLNKREITKLWPYIRRTEDPSSEDEDESY